MRVVGGKYRSRALRSLKGLALRPTSDRLRETLFNILGPSIEGARFVDLFAGTGAVGIEAMSRGASEAFFIEKHAPAVALIRKNLESLEVPSRIATVLKADALSALEQLAASRNHGALPFDYVFLDPPYAAASDYDRVLVFLGTMPLLTQDARVIAEHSSKVE